MEYKRRWEDRNPDKSPQQRPSTPETRVPPDKERRNLGDAQLRNRNLEEFETDQTRRRL